MIPVPIAIPIGWFYIKLTTIYLVGSREFKRAESTTRSPIFGAFGETMAGVVTIRAYADTARFMRRLFTLQVSHLDSFHLPAGLNYPCRIQIPAPSTRFGSPIDGFACERIVSF